MSKIDDLIRTLCPEGVKSLDLGSLCRIETGKRDANESVENGDFLFFTTARESSRIDSFRWDCEALLVAGNANVGNVKHYIGKFDAYQRTYVLTEFLQGLNAKYLYYALQNNLNFYLDSNKNVAAMTYIVLGTLKAFKVPIPPLEVQKEIVSILDKFTQLEAELEAELEARKTQYEVMRDRLLDFSGDLSAHPMGEMIRELRKEGVRYSKLGDLLRRRKGIPITAGEMKLLDRGNAAVRIFAGGQTFVDVDSSLFEERRLVNEPGIIVKSRGNIAFAYWKTPFTHKGELWSYTARSSDIDLKFVYYFLQSRTEFFHDLAAATSVKMPQLSVGDTDDFLIPVPPVKIQMEIVSILDKLDALMTDISHGLPAEIAARRKQYEYYRNKLLTFKKMDAA